MIQEARDTLVNLKYTLENIRDKRLDALSGWNVIRNNAVVNGIVKDRDIEGACSAFLDAAARYTGKGDPMQNFFQDDNWNLMAFENAMDKLLDYRTALREARGRAEARIIRSINETEVDDPF